MPEYLSPGVYIEEFEIGARPLEGVSTSTAGFLGETERGPTVPCLVTSWFQYQRYFGTNFEDDKYLPEAVEGFFANGGARCFIGRVVKYNLNKSDDKRAESARVDLKAGDNVAFTVDAIGEGGWGNRVVLQLSKSTSISKNDPTLFKLDVFYWAPSVDMNIDIGIESQDFNKFNNFLKKNPPVSESFQNVSIIDDSPYYIDKVVKGVSRFINISIEDSNSAKQLLSTLNGSKPVLYLLKGGTDGNGKLTIEDYLRSDSDEPGKRRGLTAFAEIENISIIYVPNAYGVDENKGGLVKKLIEHCTNLKYRFAIIDAPQQPTAFNTLFDDGGLEDTEYAAFYYPWIKVINSATQNTQIVPPGGYIAGIYARSDTERGVHKAPANEVVMGAVDVQFQITKGQQDIYNPKGVNVIRVFRDRGIRVWGARTLSSDSNWKYINVRRLFIFIEATIDKGTQFVVFEPNNESLWARVRATITQFLTGVWRSGALMGTTPEEAFFVKCDRTTMTPDDIDNGRLVCVIGIAPVKPAEFVIFRLTQTPNASEVTL